MDYSTIDPNFFGELDLSYPVPGPYVTQEAYEPNDFHLALNPMLQMQPQGGHLALDPTPQMQLQGGYFTIGPSELPPAFSIHEYRDAESESYAQTTPAIPMGPPIRPRKRKAPTLHASAWEPYKARIVELHNTQGLPLKEVKEHIENEFGFVAEVRQYRTRISQWRKDKNIKPEEMRAIVRKRQQRKLREGNKAELVFTVRGQPVEPQKVDRWMKRNNVSESMCISPAASGSTPSAVYCRTISERSSPVPSPAYSSATPIRSPGDMITIAQSPQMFSPALSVSSIVRPQGSTFVGQSPRLSYQSLPTFFDRSPTITDAFQAPLDIASGSLQYRYKQAEEMGLREELSRAEILFGTYHSETLGILFKLGAVLIDQGRYKSAEEIVRRLVEGRQIVGGKDDIDTLNALDLLGIVLRHQGLYARAEKLHQRTFKVKKDILGDKHLDTLRSMDSLASTYLNQGQWKEAEELEVQVMATRKRVLGEEHPDTLSSIA
ncbi:hypothetical protein K505DRAFT_134338, partial [Melanomma pulvis-pyrius CBS 109.77]